MNGNRGIPHRLALFLLAVLAILAYAPAMNIPLLEDDFPNIWTAQELGSPAGVVTLFHNPVFRLRATSFWIMFLLWKAAKLAPLLYRLTSLLLHIANVWLLYGVCLAWPRMRAAAFWAAGFFAIAEGHQEAVMWFSAINELLQFFFGIGALWCWLRGRIWWVGIPLFALALLSKESALIVLPLFWLAGERRPGSRIVPYLVLAALAVASVVGSRDVSFRFSDGSFTLHAPFWLTWPSNYLRILWIWGFAALAAIWVAGDRALRVSAVAALTWIGIGLIPYSFLIYSTRIPSRQTYLASAGLALLVGLAMSYWQTRAGSRRVLAVVAVVILLHNVGYLWTKKRRQFVERAAPTERLIELARTTRGPIWMQCFPRNHYVAEGAVHLAAGYESSDLIWDEAEARRRTPAAVFCYREAAH